ncbi:MAG: hypothetical protein HRU20_27335 [Pseudomonadales bacterium]|nr:hypothetical protein [Pseudomonadales bacterium]
MNNKLAMYGSVVATLLLAACNSDENNGDGESDKNDNYQTITLWFQDADGDGFGDPATTFTGDNPGAGWVTINNDCDDTPGTGSAINPNAVDVSDGVDNNCDGYIDGIGINYVVGAEGPATGIVFYITDDGLHGLEAAPADLNGSTGMAWGCKGLAITGADASGIGAGAQNTVDILAECNDAGTAAKLANAYLLNGYNDWFLPSFNELIQMYGQRNIVGGFSDSSYWSSTEDGKDSTYTFGANSGVAVTLKSVSRRARAIRSF